MNCLKDLESNNIIVRSIQPETIYISYDLKNMMFSDIFQATTMDTPLHNPLLGGMPYLVQLQHEFKNDLEHHFSWDRISVGIIILELVIGSKLVIKNKEYWKLEAQYLQICSCIDEKLAKLIGDLSFNFDYKEAQKYMDTEFLKNSEVIAQSIRQFEACKVDNKHLMKSVKAADDFARENTKMLKEWHKI